MDRNNSEQIQPFIQENELQLEKTIQKGSDFMKKETQKVFFNHSSRSNKSELQNTNNQIEIYQKEQRLFPELISIQEQAENEDEPTLKNENDHGSNEKQIEQKNTEVKIIQKKEEQEQVTEENNTIKVDTSLLKKLKLWSLISPDSTPYNPNLSQTNQLSEQELSIPSVESQEEKDNNDKENNEKNDVDQKQKDQETELLENPKKIQKKEWSIDYFNELNNQMDIDQDFKDNQDVILKNLIEKQCYMCRYLTKGGEGYIFEGYIQQTKQTQVDVAFKIILNADSTEIKEEIDIMNLFEKNINVIKFYGTLQISENIWVFILEKCQHSLFNELKIIQHSKKKFPKFYFFNMIFDLLDGLIQFRIYNILHLDIKPGNILIDRNSSCLYTDFGLSQLKKKGKTIKFKGSTPQYASLQQNKEDIQNIEFSSDIFSLGKTFDQIVKIFHTKKNNKHHKITEYFQDEIISKMIDTDHNKREKCENLHKKLILNLIYGKLQDYKSILFFYQKKIMSILELQKFDQNKSIPYLQDIHLYYNQIYLDIFLCHPEYIICTLNQNIFSQINLFFYQQEQGIKSPLYLQDGVEIEDALSSQLELFQNRQHSINKNDFNIVPSLIQDIGICYRNIGDFQRALEYCKESYKMKQEYYILNFNSQFEQTFNNVGLCYLDMGDIESATEWYEFENKKNLRFQGFQNQQFLAVFLNNNGLCYQMRGDYNSAKKYYLQSLKIKQDLFKNNKSKNSGNKNSFLSYDQPIRKDWSFCSIPTNNLFDQNRLIFGKSVSNSTREKIAPQLEEIIPSLEEQIEIQKMTTLESISSNENIPQIAISINNLGSCYFIVGNVHFGINYIENSLNIFKTLYKKYHPLIASTIANLGQCELRIGNQQKALKYHLEALEIRREIFHECHSDIVASLNFVGLCYKESEDYQKALIYFLNSLKIRIQLFKGQFSSLLETEEESLLKIENQKSQYHLDQQQSDKKEPDIIQTCDILKLKFGKTFKLFKEKNFQNEAYLVQIDEYEGYISLTNHVILLDQSSTKIRKSLSQKQLHDLSSNLYNVGSCFQIMGKPNKALVYHQKALNIREDIYPKNHYYIATSLNDIGLCYRDLRDFQNQLKSCLKSLTKFEKIFKRNHYCTAVTLSNLGQCYRDIGDSEKSLNSLIQSLKQFERLIEGNNFHKAACLNMIGLCFLDFNDIINANFYFLQSMTMYEHIFQEKNNPQQTDSLQLIEQYYLDIDNHEFEQPSIYLHVLGGKFSNLELKIYFPELFSDVTEELTRKYGKWVKKYSELRDMQKLGNHIEIANSLYNKGSCHRKGFNYNRALIYHLNSYEMRKKLLSENHPDIAASMNEIGLCFLEIGDCISGLKYNLESLNMRKILFLEQNLQIATSLNDVGLCYQEIGDFQKALCYCLESLYLRKLLLKKNHHDIATSLSDVGLCYQGIGSSHSALIYHQKSLQMLQVIYKENHPSIATSLNNLGLCYLNTGDINLALIYFKNSLRIFENKDQNNLPSIANSLSNIGQCYFELGDWDQALCYNLRSFKIYKKYYKENHPSLATSLNNLGLCYKKLNDPENALNYNIKALLMFKNLFKGNHPSIATSLSNTGSCYQDNGDHENALIYSIQSLKMFEELFADNHPSTATALNNVGFCYKNIGNIGDAIKYSLQSLNMFLKLYNSNHPSIANVEQNIESCCLEGVGETQNVLNYLLESLKTMKQLYSGQRHDIAIILNNIGLCYRRVNQNKKALIYYLQSLDIFQQLYEGNHLQVTNSLLNVGQCYQDINDIEIASIYQLESKQLSNRNYVSTTFPLQILDQEQLKNEPQDLIISQSSLF